MRLMIIRHGDPDYSIDSLTDKGWREAELLADRMEKEDVAAFYVSPLGRAKDTASLTLERMNHTATECDWLREFSPQIDRPDAPGEKRITWDWLPEDWTKVEEFYRRDLWTQHPALKEAYSPGTEHRGVKAEYDWVVRNFDALLAKHGYVRDGEIYHVEKANRDTIVFFCHFGVECVLLSHLMNVSPMVLWHHTMAAPTSVTTIYTEERREGKAVFRVTALGDISHLYTAEEKPAFAGRFCETFDSETERHD
jgi:probable phosphoglycerate mutase